MVLRAQHLQHFRSAPQQVFTKTGSRKLPPSPIKVSATCHGCLRLPSFFCRRRRCGRSLPQRQRQHSLLASTKPQTTPIAIPDSHQPLQLSTVASRPSTIISLWYGQRLLPQKFLVTLVFPCDKQLITVFVASS